MKCIHVIVGEGKAHAQCDSGGAKTVVNRGIDGLVVEEAIVDCGMYAKKPMLLSKLDLKKKTM